MDRRMSRQPRDQEGALMMKLIGCLVFLTALALIFLIATNKI